MRQVFDQIRLVAPTRSTALITGESGTGKELVARAIHQLSPRKDGPFIALNCAAIPRDLAESELFGHAKGAFTGATDRHIGKFAAADRGTLLIDEIGEMELPVQAKLVRTLETRTINPVGSNEEQCVDVRVVAATHRNLRSLVAEGKFREDLYYRLYVVHIDLPPLRQRQEDIPLLAATFLAQLNQEHDRSMQEVSLDAMGALQHHHWPGNVRELRNLLERVVVMSHREVIELDDLPLEIRGSKADDSAGRFRPGATLSDLEREAIQQCLLQTGRQPPAGRPTPGHQHTHAAAQDPQVRARGPSPARHTCLRGKPGFALIFPSASAQCLLIAHSNGRLTNHEGHPPGSQ